MIQELDNLGHRLSAAFTARLISLKQQIVNINIKSPKQVLMEQSQRLDDMAKTMGLIINNKLQNAKQKIDLISRFPDILANRFNVMNQSVIHAGQMLNSLSYKNVLQRGYAIVRDESGIIISRAAENKKPASIEFADNIIKL